ncbi:cupin domain-containing protein [Dongia soli]|uniref:Cupin domain-containing protein n=1 Tax=Dongia soli TaxID=600628 RepID=A0ABU5E7U4_9PROT|nr:cupin domain-containing protein [Dongia soli]MDY0881977.1 cupin domain-containing protein [Dongia soli]
MSQSTASSDSIVRIGRLEIRYLMDGTVSGAGFGMFELIVPPAAPVPPPHAHRDNEELVFVLDGKLRYSVGDETRDLIAGDHMYTPRGAVHAFSNPHAQTARALITLTPDIGAQYFRDVAAAVGDAGGADRAKLLEVMARYGLQLAAAKPAPL